jgi:hypothetical protein
MALVLLVLVGLDILTFGIGFADARSADLHNRSVLSPLWSHAEPRRHSGVGLLPWPLTPAGLQVLLNHGASVCLKQVLFRTVYPLPPPTGQRIPKTRMYTRAPASCESQGDCSSC